MLPGQMRKARHREVKGFYSRSHKRKPFDRMSGLGLYKVDDGCHYLTNCFPARSIFRTRNEGKSHWLVAQKASLKKKFKQVVCAHTDVQEEHKKPSPAQVRRKRWTLIENLFHVPERLILDRPFLLKHHSVKRPTDLCTVNISGQKIAKAKEKDFRHFDAVVSINASENSLPLEVFHTFPAVKELELAFNGINTISIKMGEFRFLEHLDLSFNNLSQEAIRELGILPRLKILLLTGNGLTSLPPNMAVTEPNLSLIRLTSKRYVLRFQALETLILDDNKLSHPSCFASLAGLRRLKKLSMEQNKIFRIPYLQQVQLPKYCDESTKGKNGSQKESNSKQKLSQGMNGAFLESKSGKGQPDYAILSMKSDVDRTEVIFPSFPGYSSNQANKVYPLPPIFEILPVKSLKALNQTWAPPFPELRYLSLAHNKISNEDALLPVALFPSLNELVFHNNPLVIHTKGDPPLLYGFLQKRLGICLVRKPTEKLKRPHILIPQKSNRKVRSQIPKVPKAPIILELPTQEVLDTQAPAMSRRTLTPLPPIHSSTSTIFTKEGSLKTETSNEMTGSEMGSDDDMKSIESFFMTQVSQVQRTPRSHKEIKSSEGNRSMKDKEREAKKPRKPSTPIPEKFKGYKELIHTKPDPSFVEPVGIHQNVRALYNMLKHPLVYRSSKAKLDAFQNPYCPKEKQVPRSKIPAPRKTRAQLLEEILYQMRNPQQIVDSPLSSVLRKRAERRLEDQKQYQEAQRLLKEFKARYKRVVRSSLKEVFDKPANYEELERIDDCQRLLEIQGFLQECEDEEEDVEHKDYV
ncbi:X-ray radiation resistance-associated protein 1 [Dromiciops gliroides]|uniref:X-ray radiation resistance-associated protein 1 n=1 Tax=Dromiciops gliroides TaxID=33562 RepID=UPI001CC42B91|nr:X-ray radiation resistance-associated protein 1 [Dromiciops gliroides]